MEGENLFELLQQNNAADEQILKLINATSAKTKEEISGNLPLHYAVANQASEEVVKTLLEVHPDGVKVKGYNGCLPLHYAAAIQASSEAVVMSLLVAHPEGAKEKDDDGCLPLHYAAWKRASEAIAKALLKVHPDGAKEKDCGGWLPLHYAAWKQAPQSVVRVLMEGKNFNGTESCKRGCAPIISPNSSVMSRNVKRKM
mmetsp:Transcript_15743/g.33260  ORF Transcript_15743/g.33260 Transcript_15743/m.33260 type:complete len:199 (+) Transcript_15743:202-798(+)